MMQKSTWLWNKINREFFALFLTRVEGCASSMDWGKVNFQQPLPRIASVFADLWQPQEAGNRLFDIYRLKTGAWPRNFCLSYLLARFWNLFGCFRKFRGFHTCWLFCIFTAIVLAHHARLVTLSAHRAFVVDFHHFERDDNRFDRLWTL